MANNSLGQFTPDTTSLTNPIPMYMGAYHIALDKSYEPQRNNNFELQITGLSAGNVLKSVDNEDTIAQPMQNLMISVASFTAPSVSLQIIPVAYGNNKVKFAGTPEFQDSSITFNDFIGINVCKLLSAWFAQAYNVKTQKIGLKSNYAKQGYLIEYAPDGTMARQWELANCWLSSLAIGDFSQEGNSMRTVSATLTYDYAIPLDDQFN